MSTYTQILYQIVFSTKNRKHTLTKPGREELFRYISGILNNKNCHLYQIGGVADHLHIISHIHPSVALASLVKDIKLASSVYIKTNRLFPLFYGWQDGYAAFTYSFDAKENLMFYVKNQEEHHKASTYKEEMIKLLEEFRIEYDEVYL
jgi:putative transposase